MFQHEETFDADGTLQLGDAMPGSVARWRVQVIDEGSWSGSVTPQHTMAGSGETKITGPGYVNLSDPATNIDPSSSPITAAGEYLVEASGSDVELDVVVSAGSVTVRAAGLRG